MNYDDARCAELGRYLIFIGPTPVVHAHLAAEKIGVPVWVVVHHDQDLAADIYAFVVVPAIFGCLNAVANKNQLSLLQICF